MAGKKKAESKNDESQNDESVFPDNPDGIENVDTNAGPDASDGGVANAPGLDEEG